MIFQSFQNPVRNDVLSYISKEFKNNKLTDKRFCRASESAVFKAQTYLTLLESTRRNQVGILQIQSSVYYAEFYADFAQLIAVRLFPPSRASPVMWTLGSSF